MTTSTCKSCGAQLIWAKTPEGKNMPLDAKPEKRVLLGERTGLAHVVDVYTPHWVTCPNADQHRSSKSAAETPKSLTETSKSAAETPKRAPAKASTVAADAVSFATERQLNAILAIGQTMGWSQETLAQRCKDITGVIPEELSKAGASAFIGELQKEITRRAI